jgi:hypothetical protein
VQQLIDIMEQTGAVPKTPLKSPTSFIWKAKNEDWRRFILKISTSIMISIVGPASAWGVRQSEGLLIYIVVYAFSKIIISTIASKSARNALFFYRYSPALLFLSGFSALLFDEPMTYLLLLPILLGSYEGAYWTGFWDYKPLLTKDNSTPMGVPNPSKDKLNKAKLTSKTFAFSQFILQNTMRFVALQESVLLLGTLVVISEIAAHLFTEGYEKWKKNNTGQSSLKKKRLWVIGQYIILVGLMLMIAGSIFQTTLLFVCGWFIAQGSARGILRPLEIKFSMEHLYKTPPGKDLTSFQRMEVVGALVGVISSTWLQSTEIVNPGLFGAVLALLALGIKFDSIVPVQPKQSEKYEIGLRERLKFKSHLQLAFLFVILFNLFEIETFLFISLVVGFFNSIVAIVGIEKVVANDIEF